MLRRFILRLSDECTYMIQVTEEVAGIVRWKRYLDYLIFSQFRGEERDYERMEPLLRQVNLFFFLQSEQQLLELCCMLIMFIIQSWAT